MVKSCYIHIPFCDTICSYCDFCKLLRNDKMIDSYLKALDKEIAMNYQQEELDTLYIGGGTPSCFSVEQLRQLFQILSQLKTSKQVEYTIEGNFESTTREKLELYKEYGINRLSFGLESTIPENLTFLGRTLDQKKVAEVLQMAREIGFSNINVDLMYALPGETEAMLEADLDYLLSLDVEHISTYSLMIEKNTLLGIQKIKNIDPDLDYQMYQTICRRLRKNHYLHYEISNFARKGYESRHNLTYWNNQEYYGFGLGASSYLGNERCENTRSLGKYLKGEFIKNREKLSTKEKIEYEIILNLRKKEGISLEDFYKKYHKELEDCYSYQELVQYQYLAEEGNYLFIPENKWYISNEILVRLLEKEVKEYE